MFVALFRLTAFDLASLLGCPHKGILMDHSTSPLTALSHPPVSRGWAIAGGISMILLGMFALGDQLVSTAAVATFIGFILMFACAFQLIKLFDHFHRFGSGHFGSRGGSTQLRPNNLFEDGTRNGTRTTFTEARPWSGAQMAVNESAAKLVAQ